MSNLDDFRPDVIGDVRADLEGPYCAICGAELERVECEACGGEGEFDWETLQFEDPLWYQPGDTERCELCDGKGAWWVCPNAPHTSAERVETGWGRAPERADWEA